MQQLTRVAMFTMLFLSARTDAATITLDLAFEPGTGPHTNVAFLEGVTYPTGILTIQFANMEHVTYLSSTHPTAFFIDPRSSAVLPVAPFGSLQENFFLTLLDENGLPVLPASPAGMFFTDIDGDGLTDVQASIGFGADKPFLPVTFHGLQIEPLDNLVTGIPMQFHTSGFGTVEVGNSVPEPSTFALLGLGCVCLVGFGWRQRRGRITV